MDLLSLACTVGIVAAHLYGQKLYAVGWIKRGRLLSAASGVSLAFVFLYLLPELSAWQLYLENRGVLGFLQHHLYVAALVGLVLFYGVEWLVLREGTHEQRSTVIFRTHLAIFAFYNLLIGYLLVHYFTDTHDLLRFTVVAALHLIVNDHALRNHHRDMYYGKGRWLLAGAIFLGWTIGNLAEIGDGAVALLFALLAGSIIVNVLKEDLPEDRPGHFGSFAAAAGVYALLLLL